MTLPAEVVESLRELTRGDLRRPIPEAHAQVLAEKGYAVRKEGRLEITPLGRAFLAMEAKSGK